MPSPRSDPGLRQLVKFALVGGSGVVVNLVVVVLCDRLGPRPGGILLDPAWTRFNVRFYHLYATVAFVVANLWNFQLNRTWTFRTGAHVTWRSEYVPFLVTGVLTLVANLLVLTALLHRGSPVELPGWFDDGSALRSRLLWSQVVAIGVVTPLSFLANRHWTFTRGLSARSRSVDVAR